MQESTGKHEATYLDPTTDFSLQILRHRLYYAMILSSREQTLRYHVAPPWTLCQPIAVQFRLDFWNPAKVDI